MNRLSFFREQEIRDMLIKHVEHQNSDIDDVEGIGALNFLEIDDFTANTEEPEIDPSSVIAFSTNIDLPQLPEFSPSFEDPFMQKVNASGKKWVVLIDEVKEPQFILDADGFLRDAPLNEKPADPYKNCHRPIII
jgi:metal transporter CNNM